MCIGVLAWRSVIDRGAVVNHQAANDTRSSMEVIFLSYQLGTAPFTGNLQRAAFIVANLFKGLGQFRRLRGIPNRNTSSREGRSITHLIYAIVFETRKTMNGESRNE
jgi:hypothetical protein